MTDNNFNPYTAPEPHEGKNPTIPAKSSAASGSPASRSRIVALLWWGYFAYLCTRIVPDFLRLLHVVEYHWAWIFSPLGFAVLIQGLALIALACHLLRAPLLRPFFWGLVFISLLCLNFYVPAIMGYKLVMDDDVTLNQQIADRFLYSILYLPEIFVLWRYSSSSSPAWAAPRIQWKRITRRIVEGIQAFIRA